MAASFGDKTATASLRHEYEPHTDEPPPEVGDSCLLVGSDDERLAVVETTEVCVVSACQVDPAVRAGRGRGLQERRGLAGAHERFSSDWSIADETPVVCERFRVMAPFETSARALRRSAA